MIRSVVDGIERLSQVTGQWVSWLNTFLVAVICVDVVVRYLFSASQTWMTEFEWHLFAAVFLLGAAYTFKEDAHVRVDLFYSQKSEKTKAWINIGGILLFLIPWCLVVIRSANRYAMNSFGIRESSPDPGGLPARYIIKFVVVVGFVLLLLQALAVMIKSLEVLLGRRKAIFETKQGE